MEDYEKRKMERLEQFERLAKSVIEKLYYAILWGWVILSIATPLAAYYRPIPQDGFIQGLVLAVVFWLLFAMAHAMKAIGRLSE